MKKHLLLVLLLGWSIFTCGTTQADVGCLRCPSFPFDNYTMVGNGGLWVSELLPFNCAIQWDNVGEAFSCAAAGAPSDATFLVVSLNAGLSQERNFVCGSGLTCLDSGANAPFTVSMTSLPGWTDDGTEVRLTTSTDDVEIGSAATLAAKLGINGDANEIQFLVRATVGQTFNLAVIEDSSGFDLVTVEFDGDVEIGNQSGLIASKLAVDGDTDEIQFTIQEVTAQSTSGMIYENSAGKDLFAIEAGGDVEIGSSNSLSAQLAVNGLSDQPLLLLQESAGKTTNGFEYETSGASNRFVIEAGGDVEIGTGVGGAFSAKVAIDGDADETQLHIQGNATQTNNIVLAETSAGTDLFRVSNTGTLIGGTNAATITNVLTGTATLDFADPGQNNCTAALTVTVTGGVAGNPCFIGFSIAVTDVWFECQISAANTCSIRACKVGNVAEDPASGTFRCNAFQH